MNLNATLILQVISFLILMGLLLKFLYKPLIKIIEQREERITKSLEEAKKLQDEAKRYAEETHQALAMARKEAIKLKDDARKEADLAKRAMFEDAKRESTTFLEKAKELVGKDVNAAVSKIRHDVSYLAVNIAKKILAREIDEKDHKRIIDESIKELK